MFDLINGLPLHPLVVHAVVVLLPLSVAGTIAVVVRRQWALTYGWLLVGCAAAGTALLPVATSSGEALEKHVGDPGRHAALGEQLIWVAFPLTVFLAGYVLLLHRQERGKPAIGPDVLPRIVAGLAIVAALATGIQTFRVGDSGARAAWEDQVSSTAGSP